MELFLYLLSLKVDILQMRIRVVWFFFSNEFRFPSFFSGECLIHLQFNLFYGYWNRFELIELWNFSDMKLILFPCFAVPLWNVYFLQTKQFLTDARHSWPFSCDKLVVSDILHFDISGRRLQLPAYDLCNGAAAGVIHSRCILDISQPRTWKYSILGR